MVGNIEALGERDKITTQNTPPPMIVVTAVTATLVAKKKTQISQTIKEDWTDPDCDNAKHGDATESLPSHHTSNQERSTMMATTLTRMQGMTSAPDVMAGSG